MGEINVRFRMNLETGYKEVVIEYDSDEDLMRHEHEKKHRDIVKQLVGEGLLSPDEADNVKVERVTGKNSDEQSTQTSQGEQIASNQ